MKGVATIEIGGEGTSRSFFDCNTTVGDGADITWYREGYDQLPSEFEISDITNGKRLTVGGIMYTHLGEYYCWDQSAPDPDDDRVSLNITDGEYGSHHLSLNYVINPVTVQGVAVVAFPIHSHHPLPFTHTHTHTHTHSQPSSVSSE